MEPFILSATALGVFSICHLHMARLAQSAERKALNLVVVGSSPTVGVLFCMGAPKQGVYVYHMQMVNLHHK